MSFIDIKDPIERDRIVQDYIQTVQRIRERSEDEKAQGLRTRVRLSEAFSPIVEATKESTSKITEEIKKSRAVTESGKAYWEPDFTKSAIDYYLNLKKNKDTYYGIQKTKEEGYVMGDKTNIEIDKDSNIRIDDHTYKATPGLWELIMLNNPPKHYTDHDYIEYEDIVYRTRVIDNPLTKNVGDKPRTTLKFRNILLELEKNYVDEEEVEEEEVPLDGEQKEASGIEYLPGNINGLLDRLKLLYGERGAGNISATSNQIVGILDELLRMKYLSREQYNMVCKSLEC